MKKNRPNLLERIDDGEVLIRNSDDTYSFMNSKMSEPYKYAYEVLMEDKMYKGKFRGIKNGS